MAYKRATNTAPSPEREASLSGSICPTHPGLSAGAHTASSATARSLLSGERDRRLGGCGSIHAHYDRTWHVGGSRPPMPAHHHHSSALRGDLRAYRPQQQPGEAAVPSSADHQHLGVSATLAEDMGSGPSDQQRPYLRGSHQGTGVPDTAGKGPFAASPREIESSNLGGRRRVTRCPGLADSEHGFTCAWDGAERHRAPYAATNGVPSLDQDRATAASVLTAAVRAAFGRTPQAPLQAELAEGGAEGVLLDCAAGTELLVLGGTGRSNHLQPAAGPVHRACLAPPILLIRQ
jgi:hypothetical protein